MTTSHIIGVVGLGAMGIGIAQVYAAAGFRVIATDAVETARASAFTRLAAPLNARVDSGKLSADARDATLARVTIAEDLAALAPCDLIIEAIIERLDAKRALFAGLEIFIRSDAILASNTSSIPVADIARDCQHPDRVVGLHFFNPAPVMKLVELVAHTGSAPDALDLARDLTEQAGKTVIACPDRPGFIVNRCARPFYGEALALLEEGRSASDIDAAMQAAGYRLGPFSLIDLVGADINLAATEGLHAAMGNHPRYHPFTALKSQVASGNLGRKTGHGFLFPNSPGPAPADAAAITERIEATLVNEAGWLLAEGGTCEAGIDSAMKLGLNFPRGPFEALEHYGRDRVLTRLNELEKSAPEELRTRYLPAPILLG